MDSVYLQLPEWHSLTRAKWAAEIRVGGPPWGPKFVKPKAQCGNHIQDHIIFSQKEETGVDIVDCFGDLYICRIVDPSDPSTLYLTQPDEKERIPTAPVYAPNYGEDEVYEPL